MSLQEIIRDVQNKLKNNEYPNEQSISQGVVLRLLAAMKWPIHDTQLVIPEYSVRGKRVDFALCAKKNKPVIFIEVKQPDSASGADEQLFQYAFLQGIPFGIVTDGREWHFYLPAGAGSFDERRVYKLDLIERDTHESIYRLERYLSFDEVAQGGALKNAQEDYENVSKERQAEANIPIAWKKLLEEKDEMLTEVVSDKVESICGYKPIQEQIITYLSALKSDVPDFQLVAPRTPITKPTTIKPEGSSKPRSKTTERMKIEVTFPDGVVICHRNVGQTMIDVFRKSGFGNVATLNIITNGYPLVSRQQHTQGGYTWNDAGSGFFVCTLSSTAKKLDYLTIVNKQMRLGLRIKQVPSTRATQSKP
ncbi:type I restriction endonuclease [Candidatus Spongiihabitans sp.]|uniref:type I restriction endonuclease n=1 Tax=Candidatus Spongiihabitans sp. TaxID=3101308 RepID=UPI003C7AEA32